MATHEYAGRVGRAVAASFLLIIGECRALAWILREERMAFPRYRAKSVSAVDVGDELLIYTTRGCFHNPGRNRGRVIGRARALTEPVSLDEPVSVAGRVFSLGCDISVETLAPLGKGLELAPYVSDLDAFPNQKAWPAQLRRPLLPLSESDAAFLRSRLAHLTGPPSAAVPEYDAAGLRTAISIGA